MFVFPVDTDRRLSRRPWVNYGLVITNVVIFLITMWDVYGYTQKLGDFSSARFSIDAVQTYFPVTNYFFWPTAPRIEQYITYQFLHLGWLHLFGNMVFLFVFGNSVEDRLGKIGYLCLYLGGGVVAALLHGQLKSAPILGASGAVACVTAAYLVLFPLTYVRLFAWVTEFEVSSLVMIIYYITQDIVFNLMGIYPTAYLAHVGGYVFGFVAVIGLLVSRILPREPYDLVQWLRQKHRRKVFKKLSRRRAVWDSDLPDSGDPTNPDSGNSGDPKLPAQRHSIQAALDDKDPHRAAGLYRNLLKAHPKQVFGQTQQLDLANQLMIDSDYDTAAEAYELFLESHRDYSQKASVQLILGLLYARYLQNPERAKTLLKQAGPGLRGAEKQQCENALKDL